MIQAGWPIDLVFGLSLHSINGVPKMMPNRSNLNPAFFEILSLWMLLQDAECLSLRQENYEGELSSQFILHEQSLKPDIEEAASRFRNLLELPKGINEFEIVYGRLPEKPDEIAILTSSFLEILIDLAAFFHVPPEHVEQGKTRPTIAPENIALVRQAPIQVKASKDFQESAFVAVQNRGYWFVWRTVISDQRPDFPF